MIYNNKLAHFSIGAVVICTGGDDVGKIGHIKHFRMYDHHQEVHVAVEFADDAKFYKILSPSVLELLTEYLGNK